MTAEGEVPEQDTNDTNERYSQKDSFTEGIGIDIIIYKNQYKVV